MHRKLKDFRGTIKMLHFNCLPLMKLFASVLWQQLFNIYCEYSSRPWVILTGTGNSLIKIYMCTHMQLHTCIFHSNCRLRWEKWPGEKSQFLLESPVVVSRRNCSALMVSPSQLGIVPAYLRALCPVKAADASPCSFPWAIFLPKGNPVAWFPVTEIIKPRICNYLSQLFLNFSWSATRSKCRIQCSI